MKFQIDSIFLKSVNNVLNYQEHPLGFEHITFAVFVGVAYLFLLLQCWSLPCLTDTFVSFESQSQTDTRVGT